MWINTIAKKAMKETSSKKDGERIVTPFKYGWDKKNERYLSPSMCKKLNLFPLFMYYMKELSNFSIFNKYYEVEPEFDSNICSDSISLFRNAHGDSFCYISKCEDFPNYLNISLMFKIDKDKTNSNRIYNRETMLYAFMRENGIKSIEINGDFEESGIKEIVGTDSKPIPLTDVSENFNLDLFRIYFPYYKMIQMRILNFYDWNIMKIGIKMDTTEFLSSEFSKNQSIDHMIKKYPFLYGDLFAACVTTEDAKDFLNRHKNKIDEKIVCNPDEKNIFGYNHLIYRCKKFLRLI